MKLIKSGIFIRSKLHHKKIYVERTPRPVQKDFDKMFYDIEKKGQRTPVSLDENFNLVDGYTRDEILGKQRIGEIKYNQYEFDNEEEKLEYIDSMNIKRRHLDEWQKFESSLPKYEEHKQEAAKREKAGTLAPKEARGKAAVLAAKEANMSPSTFERALYIKKYATPEDLEKLHTGEKKIRTLHSQLVIKHRIIPEVIIPDGQYNVFEIDFPWAYRNENIGAEGGAGAKTKYPTIPMDKILNNEIPKFRKVIAKDAVLFMWVTTPLLSEIFHNRILEELGFEYKTMITWHKIIPKWFFGGKALGFWFNVETEHVLVGVKGNVKPFRSNLPNFIETEMQPHSQKPVEFKELFEAATKNIPGRKMFEGYARTERKGWTGFGNQLKKTVTAI